MTFGPRGADTDFRGTAEGVLQGLAQLNAGMFIDATNLTYNRGRIIGDTAIRLPENA